MKFFNKLLFFILLLASSLSHAEEDHRIFSLIIGGKAEGSTELVARQSTAISNLKDNKSRAVNFGSLLGSTKIVDFDQGAHFLASVKRAGYDYIIPSTREFMYGHKILRQHASADSIPEFISANIVDENTRRHIFPPFTMWQAGDRRICVVGLSDENIIRESPDKNVLGLDVLDYDEALNRIYIDILRNRADIVVVIGHFDRDTIMRLTSRFLFVNMYITTNPSVIGESRMTATSLNINRKPVYFVSGEGGNIGYLTFHDFKGLEGSDFTELPLGSSDVPDSEIAAAAKQILDGFTRRDFEESVIEKTGAETASILRRAVNADVAIMNRESLFYFPLKDSLNLHEVRKVIKPDQYITVYSLKGEDLKIIWEKLKNIKGSDRLHTSGITDDGKIGDVPILDQQDYTVVTTMYLAGGHSGIPEFVKGFNHRVVNANMLNSVEMYLVHKSELERLAAHQKIWRLRLFLDIGSNFNRTDVNDHTLLYGRSLPNSTHRNLKNQLTGYFHIRSWNNRLTYKTGRHDFSHRLNMEYRRAGFMAEDGTKTYRETADRIDLNNRYTYDLATFNNKPYLDINVRSEFYSPEGKHPINVFVGSGFARAIPYLWNMNLSLGLSGDRNFLINQNSFGLVTEMKINKLFTENQFFTERARLDMDARINYNPMARFNMAFEARSENNLRLQIWNKLNIRFSFAGYTYRNTIHRKMAYGLSYDVTLNYGMDWEF